MPSDNSIRIRLPDDAYSRLAGAAAAKGVTAPQLAAAWLIEAIGEHTGADLDAPVLADRAGILAVIREMRAAGVSSRGDIARELDARGLHPPRAQRWTSYLVASWERQIDAESA